MKYLAYIFLAVAALLPFCVAAQGISQLQQFTSTTSPVSGITQTTYGKSLIITGVTTGQCLTLDTNHKLTTTTCGGGGGNVFSYPFPSNATSTSIAFNGGLTGILTGSLVGNASTATALAVNGANCSAGNYPLGVDASGAVENCTADANTTYTATYPVTLTATAFGLAFGTTTSNTWAGTQSFTNLIAGSISGNAGTATGLAANGANCSAGSFPLGVDASGAVESCTAALTLSNLSATFPLAYNNGTGAFTFGGLSTSTPAVVGNIPYFSGVNTFANVATTSATCSSGVSCTSHTVIGASPISITNIGVTAIAGTANQVTLSGSTGSVTVSLAGPHNFTTLTGLALGSGTAALAAYTGTSCTNQFVRSLNASGVATCATVANTDLANSTISGIALGGTLAALTATDSTLTFSGSYTGTTARTVGINLTNPNTWTGLQQFSNASSTQFSAASQTFYIDSNGRVQAKDTTNSWTGALSPTHSLILGTGTTTTWTASTTGTAYSPFVVAPFAGTLRQVRCATDASFVGVNVQIAGSNVAPSYFIASTTVGLEKFTSSNTFTAGQKILANFGTTTTATTLSVNCTFDLTETF